MPCNVRAQLNDLTGHNVEFLVCGQNYKIKLQKWSTTTHLGDAGWHQFITRNHLTGHEMVCFSLAGYTLRITIIYLNTSGEEEDQDMLSPIIS